MTKRSNPNRSVPHPLHTDGAKVNHTKKAAYFEADTRRRAAHVDGAAVNSAQRPAGMSKTKKERKSEEELRSRTDFAGAHDRKLARRVPGAQGGFPANAADPKPPPVLVLYEDLNVRPPPKARYGQYPRGLIAKLLPWLLCQRHEILHICSGCLPAGEGIRVDRDPSAQPDILADGRALPLRDGSVAGAMLDPPYSEHYAREFYGVDYPRPSHLLREAARVVRPGGRIVFVHYITPKVPKGAPIRFVRAFGLSTGFDMPMRAVTIFERNQVELDLTRTNK